MKLLAVDGNSLIHRLWHANNVRGETSSEKTWEGVLNLIGRAGRKVGADRVLLALDDPEKSARREEYPAYKHGRNEKDPELARAVRDAGVFYASKGIQVAVRGGLEADDILAGCARWGRDKNIEVTLMTSDRDSFALIGGPVTVLRVNNGGLEMAEIYDSAKLEERYGIKPENYRLYAAIRGDKSDNLPGVDGIGEKGAAELVGLYPDLERLKAGLEKGEIRKAHASKLQADGALEKLELNLKMMAFREVEIRRDELVELAVFGVEGGQASVSAEPEENWVVDPPREHAAATLQRWWEKQGGVLVRETTAAKKEERQDTTREPAGAKRAGWRMLSFIPNPRPPKSLL